MSDLLGITANPRETYVRKKVILTRISRILRIRQKEDADAFVLGLPKNMDGTEGDRAIITREFGYKLGEASGLPIFYQDERLTTVSAERMLIDADVRREKRKKSSIRLPPQSFCNPISTRMANNKKPLNQIDKDILLANCAKYVNIKVSRRPASKGELQWQIF